MPNIGTIPGKRRSYRRRGSNFGVRVTYCDLLSWRNGGIAPVYPAPIVGACRGVAGTYPADVPRPPAIPATSKPHSLWPRRLWHSCRLPLLMRSRGIFMRRWSDKPPAGGDARRAVRRLVTVRRSFGDRSPDRDFGRDERPRHADCRASSLFRSARTWVPEFAEVLQQAHPR